MSQLTFGELFGEPGKPEPVKALAVPVKESWYTGRTLSHSSVSLYKTCPQKWKFRYIDKIPESPKSYFSFGKSVHNGLEFLFTKSDLGFPTLENLLSNYKNGWIREGYESVAQERWFFNEGDRIMRGFYAKHQNESANVFQVELKFTIDVGGVPVLGYIDRIDETKNGNLAVIDYKTGKPFDKARVRQDPQLTLYQMAVQQLLGKKVETLTLYHLNSLTPLTVPAHSVEMEENVTQSVVETAKGITENKFDPKPEAKGHCQWCDYLQICPAFANKQKPVVEKFSTPQPATGTVES